MQEESDLVTGEAVVLDLRVAKLASRGVAMLIDVLVQGALLLVALVVLLLTAGSFDSSLTVALLLAVFVLVVIGYPVLFETLSRGRSLGKLALGLRVVRLDGGPIRFRHALTRGLAGFFVDFWALGFLGAVALIVSLTSSNGRRVGDYLAGTLVIRERVPDATQTVPAMPPGLAPWAAQFDLSQVTDDLALAARQYLGRYHQLRPEAAHSLGYGLAQQMAAALGIPMPEGMPPWILLTTVLAERRNRAQARFTPNYPGPGYPVPGQPVSGYPVPDYPQASYQPGQPTSGQPPPGYPLPNQPVPGQPPPSYPQANQPPGPSGSPPGSGGQAPADNPFTPPS
ncbi:RDD family protein [Amycolatopsis jiangsuensis]|uniref:Putative RDD family membrane protein YckC n=1 Tax=Amycolatopsis jiangsuensis TaxID=1181879 RepID=A0A840ITM7_9PSEU|nr:RDD family protein [Amycolatopsis jiangsuensis]MBB4686001.1 putative RDD family membrane protein YckC [Amycolatopsis jiangsuensis]